MKRLLILVLLAIVAWKGFGEYQSHDFAIAEPQGIADVTQPTVPTLPTAPTVTQHEAAPASLFKCDGRTYCSQMTSCEEATFFLKNCPGVKMDGDNDGIPCERQWCKS